MHFCSGPPTQHYSGADTERIEAPRQSPAFRRSLSIPLDSPHVNAGVGKNAAPAVLGYLRKWRRKSHKYSPGGQSAGCDHAEGAQTVIAANPAAAAVARTTRRRSAVLLAGVSSVSFFMGRPPPHLVFVDARTPPSGSRAGRTTIIVPRAEILSTRIRAIVQKIRRKARAQQ